MNNGLAMQGHILVLTSSGQTYFHIVPATFHVLCLFFSLCLLCPAVVMLMVMMDVLHMSLPAERLTEKIIQHW
jgi:hypothetical protein